MSDTNEDTAAKIRELNDKLRKTFDGGKLMLSRGIIDRRDVWTIIERVATYSDFDEDDDPYKEHDFGAFESNGDNIFWKIDYYDSNLEAGSPNPADDSITTRILTVMLAEEY